jgi:hypothetical protein
VSTIGSATRHELRYTERRFRQLTRRREQSARWLGPVSTLSSSSAVHVTRSVSSNVNSDWSRSAKTLHGPAASTHSLASSGFTEQHASSSGLQWRATLLAVFQAATPSAEFNYSRPAIAINRRPVTSRVSHNASCVFTERVNKIAYHLQSNINCGNPHSGKTVSPMPRPLSTGQKHFFSVSGTHFCSRLSKPQGLEKLQGLSYLKELIHLIGSRTCDLPACSIMPYRIKVNSSMCHITAHLGSQRSTDASRALWGPRFHSWKAPTRQQAKPTASSYEDMYFSGWKFECFVWMDCNFFSRTLQDLSN